MLSLAKRASSRGSSRPANVVHMRVTTRSLTRTPPFHLSQDGDINAAKMQVQGQLAAQYIQDVMQVRQAAPQHRPAGTPAHACARRRSQKVTDKCFVLCVPRPGAKLDDTEKMCTAKCMDRYLDAMALVSQAWAARAKQQAAMGGGPPGLQ